MAHRLMIRLGLKNQAAPGKSVDRSATLVNKGIGWVIEMGVLSRSGRELLPPGKFGTFGIEKSNKME